jgi:predicted nucleic acid-binding protein
MEEGGLLKVPRKNPEMDAGAGLDYNDAWKKGMRMLNAPKTYVETSVFNWCFSDQDDERRRDALKFFDEVRTGVYAAYASEAVVEELKRCTEPKRTKMLGLMTSHKIAVLEKSEEAEALADTYVAEGAIPIKFRTDALHIALATVNGMQLIVSYNFKHIVKRRTIEMTSLINVREGYSGMRIYSPTEVIDDAG